MRPFGSAVAFEVLSVPSSRLMRCRQDSRKLARLGNADLRREVRVRARKYSSTVVRRSARRRSAKLQDGVPPLQGSQHRATERPDRNHPRVDSARQLSPVMAWSSARSLPSALSEWAWLPWHFLPSPPHGQVEKLIIGGLNPVGVGIGKLMIEGLRCAAPSAHRRASAAAQLINSQSRNSHSPNYQLSIPQSPRASRAHRD